MVGNQLIIRVERQRGKAKKLKDWDPPCDCDVEIVRPTSKEGPKILRGADNNRILFRVERSETSKEEDQDSGQTISYEVRRENDNDNSLVKPRKELKHCDT